MFLSTMGQPQILGVRVTDSSHFDVIQEEMASLAQRHGLELIQTELTSSDESDNLDQGEKFLAEKSRITFDVFSKLSHELRTPLGYLIGASELLIEHKRGDIDLQHEEIHYLERLNQNAKRLLVLINDVIDYAKIESDKLTLEPTRC